MKVSSHDLHKSNHNLMGHGLSVQKRALLRTDMDRKTKRGTIHRKTIRKRKSKTGMKPSKSNVLQTGVKKIRSVNFNAKPILVTELKMKKSNPSSSSSYGYETEEEEAYSTSPESSFERLSYGRGAMGRKRSESLDRRSSHDRRSNLDKRSSLERRAMQEKLDYDGRRSLEKRSSLERRLHQETPEYNRRSNTDTRRSMERRMSGERLNDDRGTQSEKKYSLSRLISGGNDKQSNLDVRSSRDRHFPRTGDQFHIDRAEVERITAAQYERARKAETNDNWTSKTPISKPGSREARKKSSTMLKEMETQIQPSIHSSSLSVTTQEAQVGAVEQASPRVVILLNKVYGFWLQRVYHAWIVPLIQLNPFRK